MAYPPPGPYGAPQQQSMMGPQYSMYPQQSMVPPPAGIPYGAQPGQSMMGASPYGMPPQQSMMPPQHPGMPPQQSMMPYGMPPQQSMMGAAPYGMPPQQQSMMPSQYPGLPPQQLMGAPGMFGQQGGGTQYGQQGGGVPVSQLGGPFTLDVVIRSGRNLVSKDITGKSDPYCILRYGYSQYKTPHRKRTLNPSWNSRFSLKVKRFPLRDPILVHVFDKDTISDDPMGHVKLDDPSRLQMNVPQERWYRLEGVSKGEILVEMTVHK